MQFMTKACCNIVSAIKGINKDSRPIIIGIDGRCGSGKTTLAEELSTMLDCSVFHMDDFFLRNEQRTPERIDTPGEFVDYERFLEEILTPIKERKEVCLRKFCHDTFEPGEPKKVEIRPYVIVEGSYSCNKHLISYYDMTIFVTADLPTRLKRIEGRNPDKFDLFVNTWIPLEEKYFECFAVEDNSDLIYRT